jgi:hypothetical protein
MDKDSVAAAATKVTYGGASGAILFVLHGVEPVTKGYVGVW